MTKTIINIVLTIIIIGLTWFLYTVIQEPITFDKAKTDRYEAAKQRLKEIREAQFAYKDLKGKYAKTFDELLYSIQNDTFPVVAVTGDPDLAAEDSTYIVTRDTTYISMREKYIEMVKDKYPEFTVEIDSLPFVPFGKGVNFDIGAGEITSNRVVIQVFEVSALESVLLQGLNNKYIDKEHRIQVGSMYEGTASGNWE